MLHIVIMTMGSVVKYRRGSHVVLFDGGLIARIGIWIEDWEDQSLG